MEEREGSVIDSQLEINGLLVQASKQALCCMSKFNL